MKATALLTALLGILLAGCSVRKPAKAVAPPAAPKPVAAAPPTPAPPLSIPQTRVALPAPQPLDPAALVAEPPPVEPPPAPPARSRRAGPPASPPATPPAAPIAPPEPRDAVQEIVTPTEAKRLQDRARARRSEVIRILDQLKSRRLTSAQQDVRATIQNFLALSEEAEKRDDWRQADALAERAQILAKELQSGK
jgi:hypothetical protein